MSDPVQQPAALVHTNTNEVLTSADLDRMGDSAQRSFLHILAMLWRDEFNAIPLTGFLGDACKVEFFASQLTVRVASGIGFYYDPAESSDFDSHYKPIWLTSPSVQVLATHNASLPRIDIICLAPAVVLDVPRNVSVQNGTTNVDTTQLVMKRERRSCTVQVVTGTPATSGTMVPPATPAGYVRIAEVYVPAASGDATVIDVRPIVRAADTIAVDPPAEHVQSYVVSSGDFFVSQTTPPSMALSISGGVAVFSPAGAKTVRRVRIPGGLGGFPFGRGVTIGTAHPTLPRFDLVSVSPAGVFTVTTGTPSATPVETPAPVGHIPLAAVAVAAAATSIAGGSIFDRRPKVPQADRAVQCTASFTGTATVTATLQIKDAGGNFVAQATKVLIELINRTSNTLVPGTDDPPAWAVTKGTADYTANDGSIYYVVTTDNSGGAVITMGSWTASKLRLLKITPVDVPGIVTINPFTGG